MAQFDVFRNPGRERERIPYLVTLQSTRLDRARTRFVAPLVLRRAADPGIHPIAPAFQIESQDVFMDVFNLAAVPVDRLGEPVASLRDDELSALLSRALDELVSQA